MKLHITILALLTTSSLTLGMEPIRKKTKISGFEQLLQAAFLEESSEGPIAHLPVEVLVNLIEFVSQVGDANQVTLDTLIANVKNARLVNTTWKNIIDSPVIAQQIMVAIHLTLADYSPTFVALYLATPGAVMALKEKLAGKDRSTLIEEAVLDILKSVLGRYEKVLTESQAIAMLNALVKLGVTKEEFKKVFQSDPFIAENISDKHGYLTQLVKVRKTKLIEWLLDHGMDPNDDDERFDADGNHFSYALRKAVKKISSASTLYKIIEFEAMKGLVEKVPYPQDSDAYIAWIEQMYENHSDLDLVIFEEVLETSPYVPIINLLLSHGARMDGSTKEILDEAAQYDDAKILKYRPEPEAGQ